MAAALKARKSALKSAIKRSPKGSRSKSLAQPSSTRQSTVKSTVAPEEDQPDAAAARALALLPPTPPASRAYGNYALKVRFPEGMKGIIKDELFEEE